MEDRGVARGLRGEVVKNGIDVAEARSVFVLIQDGEEAGEDRRAEAGASVQGIRVVAVDQAILAIGCSAAEGGILGADEVTGAGNRGLHGDIRHETEAAGGNAGHASSARTDGRRWS